MRKRKRLPGALSGATKALYGIVVVLVDTDTHEEIVRHLPGYSDTHERIEWSVLDCVRQACELCEQLGPGWRIRTISSPTTVLRDVRNYGQPLYTAQQSHTIRPRSNGRSGRIGAISPEETLLAKIGRKEMAELPPWRTEALLPTIEPRQAKTQLRPRGGQHRRSLEDW